MATPPNTPFGREEAAKIVSVPKKTLTDYLLLIRQGRHFGFDFKVYKFSKFGVLRSFVQSKVQFLEKMYGPR